MLDVAGAGRVPFPPNLADLGTATGDDKDETAARSNGKPEQRYEEVLAA
jgi:hypothetical protein